MKTSVAVDNSKWAALGEILNQTALLVRMTSEGHILEANANYCHLSGYEESELAQKPFASFLSENFSAATLMAGLQAPLASPPWKNEIPLSSKGGKTYWIEGTLIRDFDPQAPGQILLVGFDISERKFIETSLVASEVFQKNLIEMAPAGILICNEAGDCTYVNQNWSQLTGLKASEAHGAGWTRALHPLDRERMLSLWNDYVEHFKPFKCEYRYLDANGNEKWVYGESAAIPGLRNRDFYLLRIEKDLTDLKATQRALQEQNEKMVVVSKLTALGEVAGGIAHEINNPLQVIRARANLLNIKLANGTFDAEWGLKIAESIDSTSNRIASIIRSLKSISRDDSLDPLEEISVKSIIDDTLELTMNRFKSDSVQLLIEGVDPQLKIHCRPVQICQVLLNLLNNAYDACADQPDPWVKLQVVEKDGLIELSVTNCGPTISPENKLKIFQPFFTTKPRGVGTGLGLSVSQRIAAEHNGELKLDSDSCHTRFVLRLR